MKAIRIRMVPRSQPIAWEAWPDGRPELAVTGGSRQEAIGQLVWTHGRQLFEVEVLSQFTPAGQMPVR
jgi:hypothetical protein